jgi:serine/threonine protein kinase
VTAPNVEKLIGQYRILRTLGAGGMGTVYLGEHLLLGRRAAIKTLLPSLSSQREIVDRFFTEARAISAISDPGVVQVFDFGYHVDGTAYIVMELLEGETLAARLDRLERLPLVESLRLARQLASSLAAAHEREVIHRDLKPGNVFVIRDAEVPGGERTKILDFGVCKLGDADASATQTGTMLGTPVYMSPEQCRGAGHVDPRSDVYSLGCVLFHMVTGRPPFDCEAVGDYIAAHLKEPAPAPSSIADAIPPEVDAVLARCLAKEPDQRFSSMTDLQKELEHVLAIVSDHGVAAPEPPHAMTALGEGFQSAFDVNAEERAGETPPPSGGRSWFVDSQLPAPLDDDDFELPRSRWPRRFAFLFALGLGLAAGLAGTSYVLDMQRREQVAAPAAPAIAAREPVGISATATAHVSPPPTALADEEIETETRPAPTHRQAERSQRRQHAKSNRPRRVHRAPDPPPTTEDLYDTR